MVLVAVPLITWGLARLKPAAPSVERSTVWVDTVKRGPMNRDVRGLGTLVPEETLLIPANTDGRVERILIRPGAAVQAGQRHPGADQPRACKPPPLNAEYALKAAEADYTNLRVTLEKQGLDQKATAAQVTADLPLRPAQGGARHASSPRKASMPSIDARSPPSTRASWPRATTSSRSA